MKKNTHLIITIFFATVLIFANCKNATAENTKNESDWSYSITPYFWMSGIKGDVATLPGLPPANIDVSFSDLLDDLDIATMVFLEARNQKWGLFSELYYIKLSTHEGNAAPDFSTLDYELSLTTITVGGLYPLLQEHDRGIDIIGGLRYWYLDNELNLGAGNQPAVDIADNEEWVDVMIGIKGRTKISENWGVNGQLSVGAGSSDHYFDILGTLNYVIKDNLIAHAGYRYQEVDYSNGDFLFDINFSGPILGLNFKF